MSIFTKLIRNQGLGISCEKKGGGGELKKVLLEIGMCISSLGLL